MEDAYTLTPEQIEADKIRIIELLKGTGRPGIERLVEWMETKSDFFTAPASTKYHLTVRAVLQDTLLTYTKDSRQRSIQAFLSSRMILLL